MNKLLILVLALAVPLASSARADDKHNNSKNPPPRRRPATPAQAQSSRFQAAQQQGLRNVQQQRVPRANPSYPTHRVSTATRSVPQRSTNANRIYSRPAVRNSRTTDFDSNHGRFRDRARENTARGNDHVAVQKARTNRRPRSNRAVDRNSFNHARNRWVRTRHDRNWWRSHYHTNFVLFGGGYYYFDAGYWFPAYGYDLSYNNYSYDEPISGYNDLAPGQVLENVQEALQDEGYYNGPIDGLIGPQTRAALAAYQRDHGLIITEAVDEPTLAELGLA